MLETNINTRSWLKGKQTPRTRSYRMCSAGDKACNKDHLQALLAPNTNIGQNNITEITIRRMTFVYIQQRPLERFTAEYKQYPPSRSSIEELWTISIQNRSNYHSFYSQNNHTNKITAIYWLNSNIFLLCIWCQMKLCWI